MNFAGLWRRWRGAFVALAALPVFGATALAQPAAVTVPTPAITRAPDAGTPWSAATLDIDAAGYVEEEYFIEGAARSYVATVNFTDTRNGHWDATPTGPTAPYKVRLLVERPRDPARFNGMVIVEWFNVSAQMDGGSFSSFGDWVMQQGYGYVGVSAQAAGVNHLRGQNAARYGTLNHPGDSYSYDIFSQAAQAIRGGTPLGDLTGRVRALVAWGGSQSGGRLITYVNAIHPTTHVYDGYVPYVAGWSSALTESAVGSTPGMGSSLAGPSGAALMVRDIDVPVFIQNSENEVLGSARGFHQQPDSANFRLWEHAGTAHASARTAAALGTRRGTTNAATTPGLTCENPPANGLNAAPIWRAVLNNMRAWVLDGRAPRSAPRMEVSIPDDASQRARIVRDPATGIGRGGIRMPQIAAPVATRWGERPPGLQETPFCSLYGASDPWNGDQDAWDSGAGNISPSPEPSLVALYRNNAGYVRAVRNSARGLVRRGWLLQADADALVEEARSAPIQ